jgi:hypothetical protein
MQGMLLTDAVEPHHTASTLRQRMSTAEPPGQPVYGFDPQSDLEHALRSFSSSADEMQRPIWPAIGPGTAQLPPSVTCLLRLDKSSSPVLSSGAADCDAGLQTITAFRAALQLRESQLLQPQHIQQDELLHSAAGEAAHSLHVFDFGGTSHSQPVSSVVVSSGPAQQPDPPLSELPLCMNSDLARRGSDGSEGCEYTSVTTPALSRLGAARQVIT